MFQVQRIFFYLIATGMFLTGCVKIPAYHDTAGKYNELRDIDTQCLQQGGFRGFSAPILLPEEDKLDSRRFVVLNWNSYKGNSQDWLDDFERLSNRGDLVVLQEGYLTDTLQSMLDAHRYYWDIAKAFTYDDVYAGVLTASRIKPDFLCSFRVREPISGIPKTALITRYPLSGSDEFLLLANIHMINFSMDIGAYRSQLEQLAEVLSQHRGPLIISGDFNSWSAERAGILDDFMQKLGVKAVTFDPDNRVAYMGLKVDHILYRQLVPLESGTEKVKTSDHNPMLVTFKLADDV